MKKAFDLMPVAMLSFEEFKEAVQERIREKLPEGDYDILIHKVENPTKNYEGLMVREKGSELAPTINLTDIYSYSAAIGANFGEALDSVADTYKFAKKPVIKLDLDKILDYEAVKDRITVRLINGERENPGLANNAHKELGSFVAAYYLNLGNGEAPISKKMMEEYGVSVDELHETAVHNQARVNGTRLNDILDTISSLQNGGREPVEDLMKTDNALIPGVMYILSSTDGRYGSSLILDTELMDKLADRCGSMNGTSRMYVIPSSVHEVLIMRDAPSFGVEIDPEHLDALVLKTNREVVDPKEVLGERAMIYEKESHTLYYAKEYLQGQKIEALKDRSPDFQRMQSLGPELIQ